MTTADVSPDRSHPELGEPLGLPDTVPPGFVRFAHAVFGPNLELRAPRLRRGEGHAVQRLESHSGQIAASPATVAGIPSHEPTAVSDPSVPTAQP